MPNENRYYNIKREYALKFFQVPKVFMTNPNYKKLSAEAKLAFAILSDRLQLSIKNKWFDKNGNIFFIYTGEQLEIILDCGHSKVTAVKKELKDAGLLEMKRMGQGKPNRMYLLEPEINETDIYEIDNIESGQNVIEVVLPNKMDNSKEINHNFRLPKNSNLDYRKTVTNDTDLSETDSKNINTDSINIDSIHQDKKLNESLFQDELKNTDIFTEKQLINIKLLSQNNIDKFYDLEKTILLAKKKTLNKYKIRSSYFNFDDSDVSEQLDKTFLAIKKQVRLGKIKNINDYLYRSIEEMFETLGNARAKEFGNEIYWK